MGHGLTFANIQVLVNTAQGTPHMRRLLDSAPEFSSRDMYSVYKNNIIALYFALVKETGIGCCSRRIPIQCAGFFIDDE
jgi:hypothetical protein